MRLLAFLSAGLLAAVSLTAASNEWVPIGPEGGSVNAMVVNPLNPSTVYTATSGGGVFKSVDGGGSWRTVNSGLRPDSAYGSSAPNVFALAIDPVNPSTLYAAVYRNGVFKTVNGGVTWAKTLSAFNESEPEVTGLAVDPSNPLRVYAVSSTSFKFGVLVSQDGGKTWSLGAPFGNAAIVVDPHNPGTAYAGGARASAPAGTDSGVFKTTNGGITWKPAGPGPSGVTSLALRLEDPSVVFVGTSDGSLFRSADGGGSWTRIGSGLPESPVIALTTSGNAVYAGTASGLSVSFDGGLTFTPVPLLAGNAVRGLAVDPKTPSNVYVGAAGLSGGVFLSRDAGGSWLVSNSGLSAIAISSLAVDSRVPSRILATSAGTLLPVEYLPGLFYRRSPGGVYRSLDSGRSWSFVPTADAGDIAVDAGDPSILYAVLGGRVSRSDDGGEHWIPASSGITQPVIALAADPSTPGTLYAGTQERFAGGLFKSTDGGRNWIGLPLGLGVVESIAVDPRNPARLYAGLGLPSFGAVARSVDGGKTWTGAQVNSAGNVLAIAIDPSDPAIVYATGVFKSTDSGANWFPVQNGREASGTRLVIDATSPSTVLAAGKGVVSRTTDGGQSWSSLARGLEERNVTALAIDPANRNVLYAAAEGRGVFRYEVSGLPSQCVPSPTSLCLHGSRFQVRVQRPGVFFAATTVPVSDDTGVFWFFSDNNLELTVKVLDGRSFNGHFWVFFGALSDVAYSVTVRDAATGVVRTYENPQGTVASFADTAAFPEAGTSAPSPGPPSGFLPASEGPSRCGGGPGSLCLNTGRFRVEAAWKAPSGEGGAAVAVPLTDDVGAFWFFSSNNLELMVKVVDGRPFNGRFWVFAGALSDVEYVLTVTDTQTGVVRTYTNPQGRLASFADTAAF